MSSPQGFTLVETIIATGIIVFGLLSVLSLSTASFIATQANEHEFMATQFAREGMEVVRAIRDANWLAYDTDSTTAWNEGLSSSGDYTAILQNPVAGDFLDFTANTLTDTCNGLNAATYNCAAIWYDQSLATAIQSTDTSFDPLSASVTDSGFRRLISLYPICRDIAVESVERSITSGNCAAGEVQVGIDVVVEVHYPSRGGDASYILQEHLYDWKS